MWVSISVDVDDIYEQLSTSEKRDLLSWLEDDGIIPTESIRLSESNSLMNDDWSITCTKLSRLYYQMTNEEQEVIEKIVKKYL